MKTISIFTVLVVASDEDFCDTTDEKSFTNKDDANKCFREYKEDIINDILDNGKKFNILFNLENVFSICSNGHEYRSIKIVTTNIQIPE